MQSGQQQQCPALRHLSVNLKFRERHGMHMDAHSTHMGLAQSTCRAVGPSGQNCPESSGLPGGLEPRDLLPAVGEGRAHFKMYSLKKYYIN